MASALMASPRGLAPCPVDRRRLQVARPSGILGTLQQVVSLVLPCRQLDRTICHVCFARGLGLRSPTQVHEPGFRIRLGVPRKKLGRLLTRAESRAGSGDEGAYFAADVAPSQSSTAVPTGLPALGQGEGHGLNAAGGAGSVGALDYSELNREGRSQPYDGRSESMTGSDGGLEAAHTAAGLSGGLPFAWLGQGSGIGKPEMPDEDNRAVQTFEDIRQATGSAFEREAEEERNAQVQFESELFQENQWKRSVLKAQGKLRGTQWDPLPGPPMEFSTFWQYVQAKRVRYMEYAEHGKLVAVILPHSAEELGYEVKVEAPADTPDLEQYEKVVWQRHPVIQMPADATTEIWQELRTQVVDIRHTYPLSVWNQTYPTLTLFMVWLLRLFAAVVLFRVIDGLLYPIYKGRRPDERPRRKKKSLAAAMDSDLGLFGQSRARFISAEETTGVTFDDFAGQEYVKRELQEVVKILRDAEEYTSMGVYCPKGVMLHGPPGTGKTLLAKAIAGEAGVPFFSVSGAEFVEMFVGVAAARVRDLFFRARSFSPSIIFIDEIDAIGASRGLGEAGGGNVEREQGLVQILTELDGFQVNQAKVLVIGATNRLDMLDSALLRKGRFDKIIAVGRPTPAARLEILRVHARNKVFNSEEEKESLLKEVAAMTDDYSGAELANIVNEAAILAIRKDKDNIEREELMEAIQRQAGEFKTGEEDVVDISGEARMRVAYREAAVAVLSCYYPEPHRPIVKTNAVDMGAAPNMEYGKVKHRTFSRKIDYVHSIVRACAPSVVEDMVFGRDDISWNNETSGVAVAAQMAEFLILRTGRTAFGTAYYKTQQDLMPHLRPKLVALRDEYLRYGVQQCQAVLLECQAAVEALADALMEKDELHAEEIWEVFNTAPRLPAFPVREVDEYGALIYSGRWGIHGVSLPGRATFNPGNIGFVTFGAPRPSQVQLITDEARKAINANFEAEFEAVAEKVKERSDAKPNDLLLQVEEFV